MSRQRRTMLARLLLLATGLACDGGTAPEPEPPVATTVRVAQTEMSLMVPASATLSATVHDQYGDAMPMEAITYESLDTTTAGVDADGLVTAKASGETAIVARSGPLSDTARVQVRYHVLLGEARVRLRGAEDRVGSWAPKANHFRMMDAETERFVLVAEELPDEDRAIAVHLPRLAPGRAELATVTIDELIDEDALYVWDLPEDVAYLIAIDGDEALVYVATAGHVQVDTFRDAAGMGLMGEVRGLVDMTLAGYRIVDREGDFGWVPLNDTLSLRADFAVEYLWYGIGQADYALEGGPMPVSVTDEVAMWSRWPGVNYLETLGEPDIRAFLGNPTRGEIPIDETSPRSWGRHGFVTLTVSHYDDPRFYGYGRSGTMSITEIVPTQGDAWGHVRGTIQGEVAYWRDRTDAEPFDEGSLELAFVAPLRPMSGALAAQADAETVPPWRAPFRRR